MAHPKVEKTNAARLLDRAKIAYELVPYRVDEEHLAATHVAEQLGEDMNAFDNLFYHHEGKKSTSNANAGGIFWQITRTEIKNKIFIDFGEKISEFLRLISVIRRKTIRKRTKYPQNGVRKAEI